MFDLSFLNERQRKAVETTDGAILVLASAGTGKTKVLTSRIAYLVLNGLCSIDEILAVTFTNKAAKEMKNRAVSLLVENGFSAPNDSSLWIGTFHSLALRMIRPLHAKFYRTADFAIVDADDQARIVKKLAKEIGIDDKKYKPRQIASHINQWKDKCKDPADVIGLSSGFSAEATASKIFPLYQRELAALDAIDFGDILKISSEIFKYDGDTLRRYQDKFKYIMADEYQDSNTAQRIWLTLLSKARGNICCVGDDDQSIYSWRGADVGNILEFGRDFKNPTVIKLGQNYRSTKNIINAARGLIANNSARMEKDFWTELEDGLPVIVKALRDPTSEAQFITSLISNKKQNGLRYNEIAILVRATFQTRAFEERMLIVGIPYIVVGGVRFYERKEVKDAIAYLRLIMNKDDGIAFERIVNIPKRGIGAISLNNFHDVAKTDRISIPSAARKSDNHKLVKFFEDIDRWGDEASILNPQDLMRKILAESGYAKMLQESKDIEDEAHLESLNELVNAIREFSSVREF
ncbi:MAG: UvrD-helicase domain-containing protein, partial [Holosporales bacterium]|nr:UvrD-helicase domain-containing protein [Holosporales bacterium]